jgi:hypothetical protein
VTESRFLRVTLVRLLSPTPFAPSQDDASRTFGRAPTRRLALSRDPCQPERFAPVRLALILLILSRDPGHPERFAPARLARSPPLSRPCSQGTSKGSDAAPFEHPTRKRSSFPTSLVRRGGLDWRGRRSDVTALRGRSTPQVGSLRRSSVLLQRISL